MDHGSRANVQGSRGTRGNQRRSPCRTERHRRWWNLPTFFLWVSKSPLKLYVGATPSVSRKEWRWPPLLHADGQLPFLRVMTFRRTSGNHVSLEGCKTGYPVIASPFNRAHGGLKAPRIRA